ncbi:unnamed protein product [Malus baccata var. baccata]
MESLLPRPIPIRFTNNHRDSLLLSHLPTTTRLNSPSPKPIFHHPLLLPSFFRFKPKPLPPSPPPPLRNSTALRCTARTCDHDHDHHHPHNHDHRHDNHHHHDYGELTGTQKQLVRFAKAVRWTDLADFLREHLQLCFCSASLLLAAAVCPYVMLKLAVKPMQNAFILVAFPLVGVSAALDALTDLSGGKVNILVLTALAAFASVFMGNALEGGLLLAMFNLAHIAEEYFTSRSMIDVKDLKENHPDFALVLDINDGQLPNTSDLAYKQVPVHNLQVGSYILVGAGESVPIDCEVSQGTATITIEHLTGEIKPLETEVGDRVPGGARNLDGRIIVKATKTSKESTLSRIVQLTEEAQLNKPKLQRWLDQFGEQYSMVVVVLSAAIALLGPFLFKWPFIGTSACRGSVYRALGLMVEASPCALALYMHGGKLLKASLGSVDFITSLCRLEDTSEKIKQAVNASSYGTKFVRAALSANEKVTLIHLEDRPRPGSSDVIVELQDQAKLRVMMLTGDHESSAWRVANTPEDKLSHVKDVSRETGGGLIIVGEGINDAPDLAAATVGIVLAQRASATATAVADVLLLRDNISAVPFCIAKSCQTTSLVKQSVAFTLSCIILASLPSVLGFLPLWLTVLLHEGGTLLVCLNSIRALNRGPGGRIYGIR